MVATKILEGSLTIPDYLAKGLLRKDFHIFVAKGSQREPGGARGAIGSKGTLQVYQTAFLYWFIFFNQQPSNHWCYSIQFIWVSWLIHTYKSYFNYFVTDENGVHTFLIFASLHNPNWCYVNSNCPVANILDVSHYCLLQKQNHFMADRRFHSYIINLYLFSWWHWVGL